MQSLLLPDSTRTGSASGSLAFPEARPPGLFRLFSTFFKIGLFTIGGGYAMLSMVRQIVVVQRKWMQEEDFAEMIAVLQSMPGIFAVNMALAVGQRLSGKKASLAAASGAVLPSLLIVLLLAVFARKAKENPVVESCFKGIRPCVVALILSPALQMVKSTGIGLNNFFIPLLAVLAVCLLQVSPVYVILAAGAGGAAYGVFKQRRKA